MPTFSYVKDKASGLTRAVKKGKGSSHSEDFAKKPLLGKDWMDKNAEFVEYFSKFANPNLGSSSGIEYRVGEGILPHATNSKRSMVKMSENSALPSLPEGVNPGDVLRALMNLGLIGLGVLMLKKSGNPIKRFGEFRDSWRATGSSAVKAVGGVAGAGLAYKGTDSIADILS